VDVEIGWEHIKREGITRLENILDKNFAKGDSPFTNKEYLVVYNVVYHMCTQRAPHNYSDALYEKHNRATAEYLSSRVLQAVTAKRDVYLLAEVAKRWKHQEIMIKWMKKFFLYLDRFYVEHHNLPTLEEAGMKCFKECIYDQIKNEYTRAIFDQLNASRDGLPVDASLLKSCVEVYVKMGLTGPKDPKNLEVYEADFQGPLLRASESYYERKAAQWIDADNVPTYLQKVEQVHEQETKLVKDCMDESTSDPLLKVVEMVLLARQLPKILENEGSGVKVLLREEKSEDLARLYRLYSRLDHAQGLNQIALAVKEHYIALGSAIVRERQGRAAAGAGEVEGGKAAADKDPVDNPAFVRALLDLHDKARNVVSNEFNGSPIFQKSLKDAFELFVNKEVDKDVSKHSNVELIAAYTDRVLRTGGDKLSEQEIEHESERIVALFTHISDKDIFSEYFRQHLSKRILNQRSVSNDQERLIISKIKLKVGAHFTSKMEGMLNDLSSATDLHGNFKAWLKANGGEGGAGAGAGVGAGAAAGAGTGGIDFSTQVLTQIWWPSFPIAGSITYPKSMEACQTSFTQFYAKHKESRKLSWQASHGSASVMARFTSGTYELQLQTLQAVALVLFNEIGTDAAHAAPFPSVRAAMGLDEKDEKTAKVTLHSLSCGKFEVLTKTPKGNSIGASDTFHVNAAFSDRLRKLRIQMASLERSGAKSEPEIVEERVYIIEAACVRIMKSRKVLTHQQLMAEILLQMHFFKPAPKQVKKTIETLIDREYLERDGEHGYKYLA